MSCDGVVADREFHALVSHLAAACNRLASLSAACACPELAAHRRRLIEALPTLRRSIAIVKGAPAEDDQAREFSAGRTNGQGPAPAAPSSGLRLADGYRIDRAVDHRCERGDHPMMMSSSGLERRPTRAPKDKERAIAELKVVSEVRRHAETRYGRDFARAAELFGRASGDTEHVAATGPL
jgi:hypothetical protein